MDTNDTTNPTAEAPEANAPEVDNEALDETLSADSYENDEEGDEAPEEEEELDIDGNPLKVPKTIAEKLKARMMMQADYTQKTQALAEQRKADEATRQAMQWEQKTRSELFNEEAQLYTVSQRLEMFQNVNWQALQQQDPSKFAAAQAEYMQMRDFHDKLKGHVEGRKSELTQKFEQETASELSRAVETLSQPAPDVGWDGKFDAEKRAILTKFGMDVGWFSNEELASTTDPRNIRMLNLARIGYETLRAKQANLKQPAQVAKPVPQVATGKTRTGPFNPDRLSNDEWQKWRETQLAKKNGPRTR